MAKSILIIDDEEVVVKGLRRIFEGKGHRIETAMTGLTGLHKALEGSYDLLIVDLRMPDMDGLDLIGKIRAEKPDTKAIVITGYASTDSEREALKGGAFGFVAKPFKPDEITDAVKRAFEKK